VQEQISLGFTNEFTAEDAEDTEGNENMESPCGVSASRLNDKKTAVIPTQLVLHCDFGNT